MAQTADKIALVLSRYKKIIKIKQTSYYMYRYCPTLGRLIQSNYWSFIKLNFCPLIHK